MIDVPPSAERVDTHLGKDGSQIAIYREARDGRYWYAAKYLAADEWLKTKQRNVWFASRASLNSFLEKSGF